MSALKFISVPKFINRKVKKLPTVNQPKMSRFHTGGGIISKILLTCNYSTQKKKGFEATRFAFNENYVEASATAYNFCWASYSRSLLQQCL